MSLRLATSRLVYLAVQLTAYFNVVSIKVDLPWNLVFLPNNLQSTYIAAWTKVGGALPSRDSDVAGVLTITNAQPRDAGFYTCTGSNLYQTASDRAQLIIEG